MNKLFLLFVACICLSAMAAVAQEAQWPSPSLGELARKSRSAKKANPSARVIDNDVMPAKLPVADSSDPKDAKKDDSAAPAGADKKDDDKKKAADGIKAKVEDQRKEIAQLEHEVDLLERESRVRAAGFYSDPSRSAGGDTKYAEDVRKAQQDIDTKKQSLVTAKQKLDDLQEQARKAGISSAALEPAAPTAPSNPQ
ncbi:MAG TPA: hypothetical protein VKZ53_11635 [Candidatus Angelobacter sp.]|nr:hypothetical protein [Candidatus Angelobacter sp.]